MNEPIKVQGRLLTLSDLNDIRELIAAHPHWHRTQLSRQLCQQWNWYDSSGRLKDMACRSMLLKLERKQLLSLPAPRQSSNNTQRSKSFQPVLHGTDPIEEPLSSLRPLRLLRADQGEARALWQTLLMIYHYLGFKTRVGKSLSYLAQDQHHRPLACFLFGAPAWSCQARDRYIGWSRAQRERKLEWLVNNMRFLILPWVRVPHLASHLLALALKRLRGDWKQKYAQEVVLVETFIQKDRFAGTSYQAANFSYVGETTGRSRNDRYQNLQVPIKDIYVYALHRNFRTLLCGDEP